MKCVLLLAIFLFAVSTGEDADKCRRLYRPDILRCCSVKIVRPIDLDDTKTPEDFKECWELRAKPPSCARDECIGKKMGYFKEGVINMELITQIVEKNTENNSELQAAIKENCLNADGNLSMYGMPDMCDLAKMKMCFMAQIIKKCPEWSDESNCQEVKQLVEECSKTM